MEALLQLKGIDKAFPGVKALSGASLNVYPGRVMALVGENGAGKSTMMKVLTGIYARDAGSLLWLGKETTFNGPKSSQEAGIGIIHQELNLIPQLTIAENIFLGREFVNRFGKIDWKTMYAEADKLLAKLNLRFKSDKLVGDLSIGDQQMVEIAKVLSFESKVIIMDEPTDALTDTETESLFRVIRELKLQGRGIVYISHRMKEIFEICDDVTVFRDGQFIAEREVASLTEDSLIEMMVGRKVSLSVEKTPAAPGRTVLEAEHVSVKSHMEGHTKLVVNDVSFQVRSGEIVCIAGIDGNGQTELVHAVTGLGETAGGRILINGRDVTKKSIRARNTGGLSHIPEDRHKHGLVLDYNLAYNLVLQQYFEPGFQRWGFLKDEEIYNYASKLIEDFDIRSGEGADTITRSMSGGNQQKAIVAREISRDHDILLAVQPTRGLDVGAIEYIHRELVKQRDAGTAILLISLELDEVMNLSDRILVMFEGTIVADLNPREVTVQELGLYMAGSKRQEPEGKAGERA